MSTEFAALERAVESLSLGGVVIVVDSSERENEGDFLAVAENISAGQIHFMTSVGRGHLCMPISTTIAQRLALEPLVPSANLTGPRFAMPLDHKYCSTGISPLDRELTIREIVNRHSEPHDFVRPGHIFPLIARDGGILQRPGHTEAAIDLARLAGKSDSGVLCEICSSDGRNMASQKELNEIADEYNLPIVAIDALIRYRQEFAPELNAVDSACELSAVVQVDGRSSIEVDASEEPVERHDVSVI